MLRTCPNCGSYGSCRCTWDEQSKAFAILRRRDAEARRKIGKPTVIEQEAKKQKAVRQ